MIKSITVINHLGESIILELSRPEKSGFIVEKVDGIGPGKANINVTETATGDGALYNSARIPARNIVMHLSFMWKPTIEDVRYLSYKFFPLKKKISLIFETDKRTARIDGVVESNEPDIFSKKEGASISIVCPDPYFYSLDDEVTIFSGIEPVFEFEFSNESLTDPLLVLGSIQYKTESVIIYNGDADVGITIAIHAIGDASNVAIYNLVTRETMRVNTDKLATMTGSSIKKGDDIVITTMARNKTITLLRDGVTINILNCLDKNTDWFTLTKGDNLFAYTAESGSENLQFKITNKVLYEGV